ncbi:glycosyl hydrolase family protein [Micromonospora sp. 15K316]|uniref:glycoside hydrolase family 16 protein n=1 Tax=Micromonospora sp. 15K316 TaxID=2530376 RepID=UPI00104A32B4|nr:glycoside hydrolase family 16 protein [Micromonospora sp. 15K316]TDC36178.1 glycosyl hydrolase family protein [Micromonospora sp. 15K316]
MRSIRAIAALAAATAGLSVTLIATTQAPAVAAPGAVTWSDDFNGPAGTPPDQNKWRYDIGGGGWGNNELQYYTNSTRNAALDGNGNLVITARRENPANLNCWYGSCQYTSARLLTAGTFAQAYGRFEARIKIPRGQGLWPAFWMLGTSSNSWPDRGEIDIMENVGREPSTVHGTLHGPGYSGGNAVTGQTSLPGGQALADAFHTYTVDWAPDSITWYLDGVQYSRKTPADLRGNRWVFDHPFFMIMNVAVGGNWPGSPDGTTVFPQQMVVDYVRVQAWDSGGGGGGAPIVGYGNKCVDVAGANSANGTPVQLWICNGTAAQRWSWAGDGSVRALGKCLDVAGGGTANGTPVQLWDCNGSAAQRWVFTAAGDIVNPQADKCLDATGASSADGTRLQIWQCTGGPNQKWRR